MKATETQFLKFIKAAPQFAVPIYQRTYSWTEKECQKLWDDILRAGEDERIPVHFVGSIVYIDRADANTTAWEPLLVIDGQQRLATVTILLTALASALGDTEPVDGFSAAKIRQYYLVNELEEDERKHRLLLSQTDKASLIAIVDGAEQPRDVSFRVRENFSLFRKLVKGLKGDFSALCLGLGKLMMVDIKLKRGEDNPQLIFESMNSTGRELSQADLIRNYVLMSLEPVQQTHLYEQFWRPMELEFGQEAYGTYFDGFMRHFLTLRTGEIPRLDQVYEAFKTYAQSPDVAETGVEALVRDVRECARHYCAMALGGEPDPDLMEAFQDLRELKVDVAYPFLLELYGDYVAPDALLSKEDLLSAVRLVEAYVFRRAICAIPTNSLNKTFATFTKALKKDRYLESIRAHFLGLPSYRRFPSDEEFHRDIQTRDLYKFRSRSYWLRRLENKDRKERVVVDEYTIEHILPQNERLTDAWKQDLGPEWERVQRTYLHTLGNLTLTGYNSEYGDRSFREKRDHVRGGFATSPLKLNEGMGQLDTWNEDAIRDRATRLAGLALDVWTAPSLSDEVLASYQPEPEVGAGYTIDNHPNLIAGPMKGVFEAFRREVLALDPCVNEEFLKLYVAYKAETNFVDVVPQLKRLRLSLNVSFAEISDPRGLCKDVSTIGRWGNGDVEVGLASLEELPYIMGLVRQALEKQMGELGEG